MSVDHNAKGSIACKTKKIPRSIPTQILLQLDLLLMQAMRMMESAQEPGILKQVYWDAILILRRTGIRFEDLIHLEALDDLGRNCGLDQDSGGLWWLHISRKTKNVVKEYRIPISDNDGVAEALYRQQERVKGLPSSTGTRYLFRNQKGVLKSSNLRAVLANDLAPYLIHAGHPYVITPMQFRHTKAIEMIQQGVDIYTLKEFFGYSSPVAMDRYISLSFPKISVDLDVSRVEWSDMSLTSRSVDIIPCPYQYPNFSKWQDANSNHLSSQDEINKKLLITIETLRKKTGFGKAYQQFNQKHELQEVEKVIETIQQEGDENGSHPGG
jgi:site-specific recombinase XerD